MTLSPIFPLHHICKKKLNCALCLSKNSRLNSKSVEFFRIGRESLVMVSWLWIPHIFNNTIQCIDFKHGINKARTLWIIRGSQSSQFWADSAFDSTIGKVGSDVRNLLKPAVHSDHPVNLRESCKRFSLVSLYLCRRFSFKYFGEDSVHSPFWMVVSSREFFFTFCLHPPPCTKMPRHKGSQKHVNK